MIPKSVIIGCHAYFYIFSNSWGSAVTDTPPAVTDPSLLMAGGVELDDLWCPFQPKPFYDSTLRKK